MDIKNKYSFDNRTKYINEKLKKQEIIERSLITTHKKTIWNKFVGGIKEYELIKPGDTIAVCISGGKDSFILAKLMEHLQKYSDFEFTVKYLAMDPGYNKENKEKLYENIKILDLNVNIVETELFQIIDKTEKSPCYLCARMRRGILYKNAENMGCNKIALGHHMDDVIETNLMNMIYAAQIRTMMPKVKSLNFKDMELIRPLYKVEEKHIIDWQKYNDLSFIKCGCPLTDGENKEASSTKRALIKNVIENLYLDNKQIKKNIFKSMDMVDLETVIGYKLDCKEHKFLDEY